VARLALGRLETFRRVNSHDPSAKGSRSTLAESCIFDQFDHRRAPWELFNASAQIPVGVRLACERAGQPRKNLVEVEPIEKSQRRIRQREIQDQNMTSRAQNSRYFAQCSAERSHVSQAKRNRDHIEKLIPER